MTTITIYTPEQTDRIYRNEAYEYIGGSQIKQYINDTAAFLGVSKGAIAGAMVEERHAYDLLDTALDTRTEFVANTSTHNDWLADYQAHKDLPPTPVNKILKKV